MANNKNNSNSQYFNLQERYNYHKSIADTGKLPNGKTADFSSRVRHSNIATNQLSKLNSRVQVAHYFKGKK